MSIEDDVALLERVPTLRLLGKDALRMLAIGSEQRNFGRGDVLFNFYAGDEFEALTRLEAYEHWNRMPNHQHDAALLAGGLYLSLGMHNEAGKRFETLLGALRTYVFSHTTNRIDVELGATVRLGGPVKIGRAHV